MNSGVYAVLFFVLLVAANSCEKRSPPRSPTPMPTPAQTPSPVGWMKVLEVLQLLPYLTGNDEAAQTVTVTNNMQVFQIDVAALMRKHQFEKVSDVAEFDRKVENVLRECTQHALNLETRSDLRMRDIRSACLAERGIDKNDRTYYGTRHRDIGIDI